MTQYTIEPQITVADYRNFLRKLKERHPRVFQREEIQRAWVIAMSICDRVEKLVAENNELNRRLNLTDNLMQGGGTNILIEGTTITSMMQLEADPVLTAQIRRAMEKLNQRDKEYRDAQQEKPAPEA